MRSNKPRIAITMGDPSGVGPEIIVKALPYVCRWAEVVVIGDSNVLNKVRTQGLKVRDVRLIDLKNVDPKTFRSGQVKAQYGRASMEYLDAAMELIRQECIEGIVTCPISKEAINLAGYHYSGHTEYFAKKAGVSDVVMMLINDKIRFSLVTRHIPLKQVSAKLSCKNISITISRTYDALQRFFALNDPRIVVCGINPHGSDNGLIGSEENQIIKPALKSILSRYKNIDGPMGADIAIAKAKAGKYDCVIAMYHDQALIPLKLLGDRTGINLTLGLPFIRTTPLHGTAFDIAGRNKADAASLCAATKCAVTCIQNQKKA